MRVIVFNFHCDYNITTMIIDMFKMKVILTESHFRTNFTVPNALMKISGKAGERRNFQCQPVVTIKLDINFREATSSTIQRFFILQ